ncbi:MAG: ABC transporter ATP-binding protein [Candidatus Dojkabacteria bacterium]
MRNILEVNNLTKKYIDGEIEVTALNNVSFKLQEGYDIALLGPSGSGKTTLLQLAGGLDSMTEGDVIINGQSIKRMNDQEISDFRNITMGFIFQMINLQSFLTAKENIMVPMLILGTPKEEAENKADELLKQMGMTNRSNHLPSQLSGGEQQRIAVARALANDPKIIFADEPTGKLDKKNSELIIDILESLSKEKGMSVVMITHDENIAKRFSRIIRLENGVVKKDINLNDK